jgi:phosphoserine phosphatase
MKPGLRYNTVVFDCDSTLCAIEGIEELATSHHAQIEELTDQAMRGVVPLEAVYGKRLALIRPTRAQVDALAARYISTLVPDARETVAALRAEGIVVRVISGGLSPAVAAVARELGIEQDAIASVDIFFDDKGEYSGFEHTSPLARAGGKAEVLREWARQLPAPVMLVGDGATDLEARPAVDLFVAFAGVAARPAVIQQAEAVIYSSSLAPVLPLALGGKPPVNGAAVELFRKGVTLLAQTREPRF